MAIIKCKMCGGNIEVAADKTYGTCDSCGSTMTFPKVSDEQRANLFNRANHFRRQNEFDKAVSAYERILDEDNTDAEAHWGVVLSRYGIEYVEDPVSHERIPTCHRVQATSILTDEDYLAAKQYAPDSYSAHLYEEEAQRIAEIQKGILAISAQEKPYDVFICYKESTDGGARTVDSTIAQDIYYQLKQEGFNVFFARITLEDKLGQQYEPYIFAALNSAKVMLVVGTKPEYLNAVWVKNEWSRYLAIMKKDRSRLLIPCYRDMDAYDLPEELSALQSQDMSKIGFMQDLIRGIKKVIVAEKAKESVVTAAPVVAANPAGPLLKRVFIFLEDRDWESANEYCEKVLDIDPENAKAYIGKMLAELHMPGWKYLGHALKPYDDNSNYKKALRYADDNLKAELQGYIEQINTRNENNRLEGIYTKASQIMKTATSAADYKEAAELFVTIRQYKDAADKKEICLEKAEICRKEVVYSEAKSVMHNGKLRDYVDAALLFKQISGWMDADTLHAECENKIAELMEKEKAEMLERERKAEIERKEAERRTKRQKKNATIVVIIMLTVFVAFFVYTNVIIPNLKYDAAMELMSAGKYEQAIAAFTEIETHKDSATRIEGLQLAIKHAKYETAVALLNEGKHKEAYDAFISLNGYRNSSEQAEVAYQQYKPEELKKASVGSYVTFGTYEQDNNINNGEEDIEWLVLAKENNRLLVISRYALLSKNYEEKRAYATWETCSLRTWLNEYFLYTAFSSTERSMIPTVEVSADKNPYYSSSPGSNTQDKVFLLSIQEVNKYFASDSARQCKPTTFAKMQGVHEYNGFCDWWLRSPGDKESAVVQITTSGVFDISGSHIRSYNGENAVRPALWINLEP